MPRGAMETPLQGNSELMANQSVNTEVRHLSESEAACLALVKDGLSELTRIAFAASLNFRQTRMALGYLLETGLVEQFGYHRWRATPTGYSCEVVCDVPGRYKNAPTPRQRKQNFVLRPDASPQKLLLMLDTPKKGAVLYRELGITRQRLLQVVAILHSRGAIRIADYENPTFLIARIDDQSMLLTSIEERFLSAMPVGVEVSRPAIVRCVPMGAQIFTRVLGNLVEKGMVVEKRRAGAGSAYLLTDAGRRHPQRNVDAAKADCLPRELRSDRTFLVLSLIGDHAPMRAVEIAKELGLPKHSANALMQYFKRRGFIQKVGSDRLSGFALTPDGMLVLERRKQHVSGHPSDNS